MHDSGIVTAAQTDSSSPTSEELTIRPGCPEDVPALRQIFFGIYGENYPYPPTVATVCPARGYFLTAEVEEEVIGCAGGYGQPPDGYRWTEWGRLVVSPDLRYRGRGYGHALNCARAARLIQGEVALSETVCNVTTNQLMLKRMGFQALGICVLRYPGILPDKLGTQPESVLMNFLWQDGEFGGLGTRRLFLPEDWVEGLSLVLPCDRLQDALKARNGATHGQRIWEHAPFRDQAEELQGCAMVDIVVNHPSAPEAIAWMRSCGYRLAGFMPGVEDATVGRADRVRLYRVPDGTEIDWSLIKVLSQLVNFKAWMAGQAR